MPGFIIHLSAAQLALSKFNNQINSNDFLFGNLAPDVWKEKTASHFRHPSRFGQRIEYPDLDLFLEKYRHLLSDSSCLGYFFHLYIDRCFFKDYLPKIVTFLDESGQEESKINLVVWAKITKTDKIVPVQQFFSDQYYYGDFTMMNNYLAERYHVSVDLNTNVENPGIEEVDYSLVEGLLKKLEGWFDAPKSAISDLKVFDVEDLCEFLEEIVDKWFVLYHTLLK